MKTFTLKQTFIIVWVLCIIGALALLPYAYLSGVIPSTVSLNYLVTMAAVQAALLFGGICWLSYLLIEKVDLHPFRVSNFSQQVLYPGVVFGVLIGLIIFALEKLVFYNSALSGMHPPFWAGALAALYGGINEEVLMRLFLLTLIYFVLTKMFAKQNYRSYLLWASIIAVALGFGIGHLVMAFKMGASSSFEIARILLLNGIAGIVLGWLYCRKGFWTAVTAHVIADLMIHAILI